MPRRKKPNDYGTGIPYHEVEALARVLLPEIQAFFESEDGQREYAEWKAKQQAEQEDKVKQRQEHQFRYSRRSSICMNFFLAKQEENIWG